MCIAWLVGCLVGGWATHPYSPAIWRDNRKSPIDIYIYNYIYTGIWLVVLTILKNISQWEGLSHILWEKNMFETTNQIYTATYIHLEMPFSHGPLEFPTSMPTWPTLVDANLWFTVNTLFNTATNHHQSCNQKIMLYNVVYMCVCVRVCVHLYLYTFIYMIISNYYGFTLLLDIYTHFITIHYSPTIHRSNTGPQGPFSVLRVAPKEGVHHDVLPISLSIYLSIHPSRSIHLSISIYLKMRMLHDAPKHQAPEVYSPCTRCTAKAQASQGWLRGIVPRRYKTSRARSEYNNAMDSLPWPASIFRRDSGRISSGQSMEDFRYRNSSRKKPPEGKKIHRSNCRSSCGQLRRTLLIGWLEIEHGPYPSVHQAWWHGPLNRT